MNEFQNEQTAAPNKMESQEQNQQKSTKRETTTTPSQAIVYHAAEVVSRLFPATKFGDIEQVASLYCQQIIPLIEDYFAMKADNDTLSEIVQNDPRLARLIMEVISGKPLRVALLNAEITNYDPSEQDEDYLLYQEALQDIERTREQARSHRETCNRNCVCAKVELKRFLQSKQPYREQVEEFFDFIEMLCDSFSNNFLDERILDVLWRGLFFEKEMTDVRNSALIEARNERIEAKRTSRSLSDQLPANHSSSSAKGAPKKGYIESILDRDH